MGSRCRINVLALLWCTVLVTLSSGCSDAVSLIRETDRGGVVTYLFKEDRGGPMGSPHRKEAVKFMDGKCPSGYTVIQDGEVRGYGRLSTVEGEEGEVTGRRWGMQFRCK